MPIVDPFDQPRKGAKEIVDPFDQPGGFVKEHPLATRVVKEVVRPTLEFGGLAVGGLVGAGAGAFGGPSAPATVPLGTLTGGTLGFTVGSRAAQGIESFLGIDQPETFPEAFVETAKELKKGAEIEAGGAVGGVVIGAGLKQVLRPAKWLVNLIRGKTPALTRKGIEKKAGDLLREHTSTGEVYIANQKEAEALEKLMPGLKFTRGQRLNDAQAIALERGLTRSTLEGKELFAEQRAVANEVIQRYRRDVLKETGDIGDVLREIDRISTAREVAVKTAKKEARTRATQLGRTAEPQAIGRTIEEELRLAQETAVAQASRKFDQVPNVNLDTKKLAADLRALKAEFDPLVEKADNFPTKMVNGFLRKMTQTVKGAETRGPLGETIKGKIESKPLTFLELRKMRTQVMDELRVAKSALRGNPKRAARLKQIQGNIERAINQMGDIGGDASRKFREASKFYRQEVIERFRQGSVADVLQTGARGESTRIASANIASEFFGPKKLDAADDFIRAVGGNERARQAIKDYASFDLLNKAIDPRTGDLVSSKLTSWFQQNSRVLKKFGLIDDFKTVLNAQRNVDAAIRNLDTFNKSVAGKMLGVDPEKAIQMAFTGLGAKNSGFVANELMRFVRGNPAAESGVRSAFIDWMTRQTENSALDIFEQPVVSIAKLNKFRQQFAPAIRVIYRNQPQKIKALKNIQRAYSLLQRNVKSPLGGGSDTAENQFIVAIATGAPVVTSRFALVNMLKAWSRATVDFSRKQRNALLLRALFDSDIAQILINNSRGAPAEVTRKKLIGSLAKMGLVLRGKEEELKEGLQAGPIEEVNQ